VIKKYNILTYVVFYLLLMVIILCTFGGYLLWQYYTVSYSDFCDENKQYLNTVLQSHESDMEFIENIVVQMSMNDDIRCFEYKGHEKKALEVIEFLKQYKVVSQSFSMILYMYHEDQYMYNERSSLNRDYFFEKGCILGNMSPEEFETTLMQKDYVVRFFPEQSVAGSLMPSYLVGAKKSVILARAVDMYYKDTLLFFITDKYYDMLLAKNEMDGYRVFLYDNDEVIVSRGDAMIPDEDIYTLMEEMAMKEFTQKEVEINSQEYLFSLEKGTSGISYGVLRSMDVLEDKIESRKIEIILAILLATSVLMIIVFYSVALIRKVKRLNLLLSENASYDIRCIENGIQVLLESDIETNKEELILKKSRFIRNFVRGDYKDRKEVLEEAYEAQMKVDYGQHVVLLLRYKEESNDNQINTMILDVLDRQKDMDGYGVRLISNNQNLFVLFGDSEEDMKSVFELIHHIMEDCCEQYVFAVSGFHSEIRDGHRAYLEASTAFDNHLLLDSSKIIYFNEIDTNNYENILPEYYLQRLKNEIQNGNTEGVENVVMDICNKISGESVSLYTFRMVHNEIIRVLLTEWSKNQIKSDKYYNVFMLSQCVNINDFRELLCDFCKEIINTRGNELSEKKDIVTEGIHYMQHHYSDPNLSMSVLAEHLKVSQVFWAVEFKNAMGIKPSEYLANIRMEEAKKLAGTNKRMKDVSREVGYADEQAFMRRFKKYTGMTYSQYRAMIFDTKKY